MNPEKEVNFLFTSLVFTFFLLQESNEEEFPLKK